MTRASDTKPVRRSRRAVVAVVAIAAGLVLAYVTYKVLSRLGY